MRHLFDKMYEHFRFGVSNFLRFIVSFVLFVVCYSIIYFPSWCQEEADCYKKDNPKVNMLLEYLNHEYVLIRKWVKVLYLKWAQ